MFNLLAIGGAKSTRDPRFSNEELVNVRYRTAPGLSASGEAILSQSYGLTEWRAQPETISVNSGNTPVRPIPHKLLNAGGLLNALYVSTVSNSAAIRQFRRADELATASPGGIGTAQTSNFYLEYLASGATEDGFEANAYTLLDDLVYSVTAVSSAITPLSNASSLTQLNNRLIAGEADSRTTDNRVFRQIAWSDLLDATTWGALEFATAETTSDNLIRAFVHQNELYLFKEGRTEIWSPTGGDPPFGLIPGAVVDRGIAGPQCVTSNEFGVHFISHDKGIYSTSLNGGAQKISTVYIDAILEDAESLISVVSYSWIEDGSRLSGWRFPDRPAIVYDHDLDLWHRRSSGVNGEPYMVLDVETFRGQTLAACSDGSICYFDKEAYTENGAQVARDVFTPPVVADGDDFCLDDILVDVSMGRVDIGRPPQMILRLSTDGKTWGRPIHRPYGGRGEQKKLFFGPPLGYGQMFHAHLRVTDPVPTSFYGAKYRFS